ncbi:MULTISPECIES: TonB-dependent receptor [unclassified Pseudomonas]|jgi:iron complex outermembrane receptor protein|uniref:TonB-dependent receptor n=1 Tax=unclassified Pseudomonas TaxID=196821 RepID=UPI000BA42010|nr:MULTISPECIES: TonB-dependent receptor [unclassified Pseudomonas]QHD00965.1 TonB-dependent receptor [Pseudomonas sp. S04]QHF33449.1 TonB-dependent receptor [Pseudomonas sp. S19]
MHKLNPITKSIWLTLLLAGGAVSEGLLAAETTESDAGKTSTEPALKTVTVTAQHKEETLQEIPVAVSAIQGTSITADGVRSMGDITTFVPNASAKNPDGDGRPRWYIRGLGTGDTGAATVYPVGIYSDDVYLNAPIAGGGPLYDLERIEILRGPQGTLYGKNTTAGAVNIISQKPSLDAQTNGYGTLGVGSKDERIVSGALGGVLVDEKLAARVALYSEERDGFAENLTDGHTYGDVNKKAVRVQFLAQLNPDLEALLKVHARQHNGDGSNGSLPVGRYYNVGYQRPNGRDIELNVNEDAKLDHDGTSLTFNWNLGDYTLTSITAYDYIRGQSTSDADYTPYEVNGAATADNKYSQYSQELRLASPQQETLRWLAGAHYFHETLDSSATRFITPGPTPNGSGSNQIGGVTDLRDLNYDHKTDSYALFGNLTYDFTDNFTVTGGLRYTQEKKDIDLDLTQLTRASANGPLIPLSGVGTNGNRQEANTWEAWTYDLTPEYRINDNLRVFFRYAHGFRSGGFNTGLSTSLAQLTTVDPEQLDAYEIGLKSEWFDRRLTANANIFYYDYSDIQVNLLTVNNGVLTTALTNGAAGKVKGAELELEGQPTEYLHLRAAISFLDTEYTDFKNTNPNTGAVTGDYSGNSFVRSPRNVVSLGGDYTFPLEIGGKLVAGGDVSFRDKEYFLADRQSSADKTLSQAHYTLANSRLTWFSPDEKLSVTGFVNNLTDRRYQVHGRPNGTLGQYVITYGDPRTVGLSVTSRF